MNESHRKKFQSLLDDTDFFPIDTFAFAQKFDYKVVETDQLDLSTIGFKKTGSFAYQDKKITQHYTGKFFLLNKRYPIEVKRFCVAYFLSRDYLGNLEDEVYSCITMPNQEAYFLAQKLLIPKEVMDREFHFNKEDDFETAKILAKKLVVPMNLIYEKKGKLL